MSDLERELEQELHRVLDPIAATSIPARRQVYARGLSRALFGGAGTALGVKLLTGVAVAAAAVTVAGVTTTGSLNPVVWGQQVQEQVETCKANLTDGQHGIGDCVSDFASQHGQTVASDARHHGNPKPHDNTGNGQGNGNTGANGHGKHAKTAPKVRSSPPTRP